MSTATEKRRTTNPASDVLDRQLPRSQDSEVGVLGSLLILPELCDEVSLVLAPSDFFDPSLGIIYQHVLALHESSSGVDPVLLIERLKKANELEDVGGAARIAEVAKAVPTPAHAEYYARIVKEKAQLRGLIMASSEALRSAYEPDAEPAEVLDRAEQQIYSLQDSQRVGKVCDISQVFRESVERMRRHEAGGDRGVPTGYSDLDSLLCGLQDGELIVLAARPSMGKTALAMNIAENVSREGNGVFFASLEMSRLELGDRMLSTLSKVPSQKMRNGTISTEERERIMQNAALFGSLPLYVEDDPNQTVSKIAANARRLKRNGGNLRLIIIDYLQLIEPDNHREPREQQIAKISRRLKKLSKELNLPIMVLAQLNRQTDNAKDNKPKLSHLRESGAIEQDADVVIFVHREEYYAIDENHRQELAGKAELLVRKQRNGPIGDVRMTWIKEWTRFETAARPNHTSGFDEWNNQPEYHQQEAF